MSEPNQKKRVYTDGYLIKQLIPYIFQSKRLLFFASLSILFGSILDVSIPYLIKIIVDKYLVIGDKNSVVALGIFYTFLVIFNGITTFFRIWLLSIIGQNAILKLREDTYLKIQKLSMNYYENTPQGDIIARLTSDLDNLSDLLSGQVLYGISSLLMIFGMVIVMLFISPILMLVQLCTIPVMVYLTYLRRQIERPRWSKWRKVYGELTAFMTEQITGARISLSFVRQEYNQSDYEKHSQNFTNAHMSAIKARAILWPFIELTGTLGMVLILLVGGFFIIEEKANLTAGVLILFLTYQTQFIRPITILANMYGTIQTSFASYERVLTLQEQKIDVLELENAKPLEIDTGSIEFRNIDFAYKKGTPKIFTKFNLRIQPNECLAIVGETGSGKTTLVKLLCRFYDVDQGEILIDNQKIKAVTLKSLRNSMGVVLQEPFLFKGSIRSNLCYGQEIAEASLCELIEMVGASFIFNLPDGLETQVGERGKNLSMGQRQLIAFARMLITNPKILVLDEATSSIDTYAELQIQKALAKVMKNRTSIIIAHRLSTVKTADRIIVLDNGKIVEEGNFNSLIKARGRFYENYRLQMENNSK